MQSKADINLYIYTIVHLYKFWNIHSLSWETLKKSFICLILDSKTKGKLLVTMEYALLEA